MLKGCFCDEGRSLPLVQIYGSYIGFPFSEIHLIVRFHFVKLFEVLDMSKEHTVRTSYMNNHTINGYIIGTHSNLLSGLGC